MVLESYASLNAVSSYLIIGVLYFAIYTRTSHIAFSPSDYMSANRVWAVHCVGHGMDDGSDMLALMLPHTHSPSPLHENPPAWGSPGPWDSQSRQRSLFQPEEAAEAPSIDGSGRVPVRGNCIVDSVLARQRKFRAQICRTHRIPPVLVPLLWYRTGVWLSLDSMIA